MSGISLLWSTFPTAAEAERVAESVIEERLAACVNILAPCMSIYRWRGKVESGSEVPALFKTTSDLAEALRVRIAALHSYDLPVIEAWPVHAAPEIRDWVAAETGA